MGKECEDVMSRERRLELLANAAVCFDRCMSPFSHNQLCNNNVTADECGDLSFEIADIIKTHLIDWYDVDVYEAAIAKAKENNDRWQEEL